MSGNKGPQPLISRRCLYRPALAETCLTVDIPLITAAAEFQLQTPLSEDEPAVDEDIRNSEQLSPAVAAALGVQCFKLIAGIGDDIQSELLYLPTELSKYVRLTKRLTALYWVSPRIIRERAQVIVSSSLALVIPT